MNSNTRYLLLLFCLLATSLPGHVLFGQFIQLIGHHPGDTAMRNSEVWGYEDPITGKPFAIMGTQKDILIFDVSDPTTPTLTSRVPDLKGFDIKIWDHYLYTVTGNQADSLHIIDLTDITQPVVVGSVYPGGHNLWVDEKGYLYTTHLRIRIFDLNADPVHPNQLWQGGLEGHDMHVFGDTMVYFAGYNGTYLFDITDRQFPIPYGLVFDPNMVYHHSGWMTPDGNTLFIDDELAKGTTADITSWDISDPNNPMRLDDYTDTNSIVHNLYLRDRFAITSYYKRGLRIFDVGDPTDIHLVGEYKTYPGPVEETFGGAFGVYIFAPSGYVYVSDGDGGLFIFELDLALQTPAPEPSEFPVSIGPNPLKDHLQISFKTEKTGTFSVNIYDLQGKKVNSFQRYLSAHQTDTWDLNLGALPTGSYLLALRDPVGQLLARKKIIKD